MSEKRVITSDTAELRVNPDTGRITGYAAVFDSLSKPLPFGREKIAPGAFTRALEERQDVVALRDHDPSKVLGRSISGTLRMRQDTVGLAVEIDPPATELGRETVELLRRGDISGMSFAFSVADDGDDWEVRDGETIRTVTDANLYDVSVVTTPAYEAAFAEARNYADAMARRPVQTRPVAELKLEIDAREKAGL